MVDRRLVRLALRFRAALAACVLAGLATLAMATLTGVASAALIARLLRTGSFAGSWTLVTVAAAGIAGFVVASLARELASAHLGHRVRRHLLEDGYRRLLHLGPSHELADPGRAAPLLVDGSTAVQAYAGLYVPQIAVSILAPAALIVALATLDPVVAAVVAVAVAVVPLAGPVWRRALGERGRRQWAAYRELAARTLEVLQGMPSLVLLGGDRAERRRYAARAAELHGATLQNLKSSMGVYAVIALAMGLGTSVAVGIGAMRVEAGLLTAQGLLVVLFVAGECFRPLVDLQHHWHAGFQGLAAAGALDELARATAPVAEDPGAVAPPLPRPPGLELRDATVRYPGAAAPALDRVGLTVAPGAAVAVVGASGAGKSTLLALLQRALDPAAGSVLLAGHDVRRLPLAVMRRTVVTVTQDVLLFPGTIAENLRIAAPGATDDALWRALDDAALGDTVRALPHGLATPLAERGGSWSGGQRQRLAIARALLHGAPVLLLDEATAFLDGHAEAAVVDTVDRLRGDHTIVLVAHRLSTALGCDEVVVLDRGRVAERGAPGKLLGGPSRFRALVDAYGSLT